MSQVRGAWIAGSAKAQAAARVESEGGGLAAAVSAVLGQILASRKLASPYVSIGLSGAYVRAAIMPFAKLPKAANDCALLISQRFCREHRIDPASFAVLGSPLGPAKSGGEAVLCLAVPKALLTEIEAALAACGLYADVIAPDFMLRFAETGTCEAEAPGMVLMEDADGGTVLVWDEQGLVVHAASFAAVLEDGEAGRRMAERVVRYARIVGHGGVRVAVYADGEAWDAALGARLPLDDGLKLLRWPSGNG